MLWKTEVKYIHEYQITALNFNRLLMQKTFSEFALVIDISLHSLSFQQQKNNQPGEKELQYSEDEKRRNLDRVLLQVCNCSDKSQTAKHIQDLQCLFILRIYLACKGWNRTRFQNHFCLSYNEMPFSPHSLSLQCKFHEISLGSGRRMSYFPFFLRI